MAGAMTNATATLLTAAALSQATAQTPQLPPVADPNPLVGASFGNQFSLTNRNTISNFQHTGPFPAAPTNAPASSNAAAATDPSTAPHYLSMKQADSLIADIRIPENRNNQPVKLQTVKALFDGLDPNTTALADLARREVAVAMGVEGPTAREMSPEKAFLAVYYRNFVDPNNVNPAGASKFDTAAFNKHIQANRDTLDKLTGDSKEAIDVQKRIFGQLLIEASPLSAGLVESKLGTLRPVDPHLKALSVMAEKPLPTDAAERGKNLSAMKGELDAMPDGALKATTEKQLVAVMKERGEDLPAAQLKNKLHPGQGVAREKIEFELNALANSASPDEKAMHRTNIVSIIRELGVPGDRAQTGRNIVAEKLLDRELQASLIKYAGVDLRKIVDEIGMEPKAGAAPVTPQPAAVNFAAIRDGYQAAVVLQKDPAHALEIVNKIEDGAKTGVQLDRIRGVLRSDGAKGETYLKSVPEADRPAMMRYVYDDNVILLATKLRAIVEASGGDAALIRKQFMELEIGGKQGITDRRVQAVACYNAAMTDATHPEINAKELMKR